MTLEFAGRSNDTGNLAPVYDLLLQYVEAYEALNPRIEIEYIDETSGSNWLDSRVVRTAAFGMPDIVFLQHPRLMDFYFQGAFQPIPQDVLARLEAGLHPSTLAGTQVNGVTYGVPGEVQVIGLMHNEPLLNEIGISGAPET